MKIRPTALLAILAKSIAIAMAILGGKSIAIPFAIIAVLVNIIMQDWGGIVKNFLTMPPQSGTILSLAHKLSSWNQSKKSSTYQF